MNWGIPFVVQAVAGSNPVTGLEALADPGWDDETEPRSSTRC